MKLTIDVDKLVAKGSEIGVRSYRGAKTVAPSIKTKAVSFKDRMKAAVNAGIEAAKEEAK
jgi:hypothetical protein